MTGSATTGSLPSARDSSLARRCLDLSVTGGHRTSLVAGGLQLDADELVTAVDAISRALSSEGAAPGQLIGLPAERSADGVLAVLGALAAGVPFTPLPDPTSLTGWRRRNVAGVLTGTGTPGDPAWTPVVRPMPHPVPSVPAAAAYVMETSGTTSEPSAAVVGRTGLSHVFRGLRQRLADVIPAGARWTHTHPLTFGFSMCEILGALTFEGDIVVVPEEAPFSSGAWRRHADRRDTPVVSCITPSELAVLCGDSADLQPVGSHLYLILSGEAAHKAPLRELFARSSQEWLTVINTYAATETCGQIAVDVVTPATVARTIAGYVGQPLPGVDVTLQSREAEAPEVVIGGPTVGLGYLDPARTAERFFGHPGAPSFTTRDLGRWADDGGLIVTGRVGSVVKVGARWLNLDDAERLVGAIEGVREVGCVVYRLDTHDATSADTLVVAMVLTEPYDERRTAGLRRAVVGRLPVRASVRIVVCRELPRTANGKLDRQALMTAVDVAASPAEGADSLRRAVIAAWADVLGAGLPLDENLFDLGVDSLGLVAVAGRMTARLGREISPEFLLSRPTLAKQIEILTEQAAERGPLRSIPGQGREQINDRRRRARATAIGRGRN